MGHLNIDQPGIMSIFQRLRDGVLEEDSHQAEGASSGAVYQQDSFVYKGDLPPGGTPCLLSAEDLLASTRNKVQQAISTDDYTDIADRFCQQSAQMPELAEVSKRVEDFFKTHSSKTCAYKADIPHSNLAKERIEDRKKALLKALSAPDI